jgi:DNA repair protein RecO (recombination protein O)
MKIESDGILIGLTPFNERDSLGRIFTRENGVLVGMMRGAVVAKKNVPMVGQVGEISWNARLDSQLGVFHWAPIRNLAAPLLTQPKCLAYMNAAFDLLVGLLPEREAYVDLYDNTLQLLKSLADNNADAYLKWEINLLRELGYALDLSRCSGCGTTDNLNFLSPRTGRAVCDVCAAPYINKLYKLPVDLTVTGRFLDAVCVGQGIQMPVMRKLLK